MTYPFVQRPGGRGRRSWAAWLLAIPLAIAFAMGIVRPNFGVAVAAGLVAIAGLCQCIRVPESGVRFCLWAFPWYAVLRGAIILQFPVALFGVRFWAELVMCGVFAGLLLRYFRDRTRPKLFPDDTPAFLYLLMCGYGALLTGLTKSPLFLIYGFHFVLFPSLFYWAARWLEPDSRAVDRLLRAFLGGFLVLALASLWAFLTGPEFVLQWNHAVRQQVYDLAISRGIPKIEPSVFWRSYLRMQSLLFEENVWGSLCGFVSLLSAAFLVVRKRSLGWLSLLLLSTICLFLSIARGALVGWVVGASFLMLFRQRYSWRLYVSLATVLAGVGGSALYLSEQPNVALWLQLGERAVTGIQTGDLDDRTKQWEVGWDILQRNPSGTGLGTVGYSASGTGIAQSKVADGNYVSLGAEMGWLGLALLATTMISMLWVIFRNQRAVSDPTTRALGLGLMAYSLSMVVHAVTANVFEYYYTFPVFWLFFGVYVARSTDRRDVA